MGEYSSQIKNHPLHRPMAMYFADKKEMQKEALMEAKMEEELRKSEVEIWMREMRKLKKIILLKKNSINVCLVSKRKFSSLEDYERYVSRGSLGKKLKVGDSSLAVSGKILEGDLEVGETAKASFEASRDIAAQPEPSKEGIVAKDGQIKDNNLIQIKFVKG